MRVRFWALSRHAFKQCEAAVRQLSIHRARQLVNRPPRPYWRLRPEARPFLCAKKGARLANTGLLPRYSRYIAQGVTWKNLCKVPSQWSGKYHTANPGERLDSFPAQRWT